MQDNTSSSGQPPVSDCGEIIRKAFSLKGLSADIAKILCSSLANSTIKQYSLPIKKWAQFSKDRHYSIFNPSVSQILKFLYELVKEGASFGTINNAKAEVLLISKSDFSKNALLRRFMNGVYKLKPVSSKYNEIWDISPVLDKLASLFPLENLSLAELSMKLVLLLALATAQRLQTLSLIKLSNIKKSEVGYVISITDLIKTSRPGTKQPVLMLPFFRNKM